MYLPLFAGVCVRLCFGMHYFVNSSFSIILMRKGELLALLLLSFGCLVTENALWLFLTVPWAGLQFVIKEFPDHIHFFFYCIF